jgi:molybdenum cofactor guanylyltransferase
MLGIILCGGQSSRMGSDKGLLVHEAKTWAQTAFDKLSILNIPISFSVNQQQQKDYAKVFTDALLIADNPSLEIKGPLLGALSAHLQHPTEDLFLLACDLPLMETGVLEELFSRYQNDNNYEAYIFTDDHEPEPLCGIYTSKGLAKIIALQKQDNLARHSMKFILSQFSVCSIPLQENQKKFFRNFNAHAELNGL